MISTCIAFALVAQSPTGLVPLEFPDHHRLIEWHDQPGFQYGQPFDAVVSGNLTDTPDQDALALINRKLILIEGVSSFAGLTTLQSRTGINMNGPVGDVAIMTGIGERNRDGYAAVDFRNGLTVGTYNEDTGDFDTTILSSAVEHKRATDIEVFETSPGVFLIVTVKEEILKTGSYDSAAGTYQDLDQLDTGVEVLDALFMNWDGGTDLEVVARRTSDVAVYTSELDTTPVATIAITADAIQAFDPCPGDPEDMLVMAYDNASGDPILEQRVGGIVVSSFDCAYPTAYGGPAVDLDVDALVAGDWDSDGDQDLAFRYGGLENLMVVLRNDTTGLFEQANALETNIDRLHLGPAKSDTSPSSDAPPSFLPGGLLEPNRFLIPSDRYNGIVVLQGPQPVCTSCEGGGGGNPIRTLAYEDDDGDTFWKLHIVYDIPVGLPLANYNFIDLGMWVQDSEPVEDPVNPIGLKIEPDGEHLWLPIPSGASAGETHYSTIDFAEIDDFDPDLIPPKPGAWDDEGPIFWISMRFIGVDEDWEDFTVPPTSALHCGWRREPSDTAGDNGDPYHEFMVNYEYTSSVEDLLDSHPNLAEGDGHSFSVGAVSIVTAIPRTGEGQVGSLPPRKVLDESGGSASLP